MDNYLVEYKQLQEKSFLILDEIKKEFFRVFQFLLTEIEGYNLRIAENYISSSLHNSILNNEPVEVTVEISKFRDPFFRFTVKIPLSLLFSDDAKIVRFWRTHDRVRYFQKKFYQPV